MKQVYRIVPANDDLLLWDLVRVHILISTEIEDVVIPYAVAHDVEVDIMTDYATPSRVDITMSREDAIVISLLLREELKLKEITDEE